MNFDLHIHSKYSYDSLMIPKKILKIAKKRGLGGIAVTDHDTLNGGMEVFKLNKDKDFEVIVGVEKRTNCGDIIGLFVNEEIKSSNFEEVTDEIRSQGGLSILAHPYRHNKNPEKLIPFVDLVEGFNARSKKEQNDKAMQLAHKNKKPITAGSDAHFSFEIGRGGIVIKGQKFDRTLKSQNSVFGVESPYYLVHSFCVVVERLKILEVILR